MIVVAFISLNAMLVEDASGQRFDDQRLGVSFDPPEGWILKELTYQDGGKVKYSGPVVSGAVIPSIEVRVMEYGLGLEDMAFLLQAISGGAGKVLSEGKKTINGWEAYTLVHRYSLVGQSGVVEIDHMVLFSGQGKEYMVIYANDERYYDRHLPIFERFLESLRLEGLAPDSTQTSKQEPKTTVKMCGPGTMLDRSADQCVPIPTSKDGGGCLIATAAYGTELAPEVQNLREIRGKMYQTGAGDAMRAVNDFYYKFSPIVADWERENVAFREAIRLLITPSMLSFAMLDHKEIGSEEGLITYVLGIVTLNIGMYFVAPVIVVCSTKRFLGRQSSQKRAVAVRT